jgi:hypothetical protein
MMAPIRLFAWFALVWTVCLLAATCQPTALQTVVVQTDTVFADVPAPDPSKGPPITSSNIYALFYCDYGLTYEYLLDQGFSPTEGYAEELKKKVNDTTDIVFLFDLLTEKPLKREMIVLKPRTNLAGLEQYLESHFAFLVTPIYSLSNGVYGFVAEGVNDGHGMLFQCEYVEDFKGNYLYIEHYFPAYVRNGVYKK